MKKYKINPQRLSRIIASKECKNATDNLLDLYGRLSVEQRLIIKNMLIKNKNEYIYNKNKGR